MVEVTCSQIFDNWQQSMFFVLKDSSPVPDMRWWRQVEKIVCSNEDIKAMSGRADVLRKHGAEYFHGKNKIENVIKESAWSVGLEMIPKLLILLLHPIESNNSVCSIFPSFHISNSPRFEKKKTYKNSDYSTCGIYVIHECTEN